MFSNRFINFLHRNLHKHIPLLLAAGLISSCSTSGNLPYSDLSHLQLNVEEPALADGLYRIQISAIDDSNVFIEELKTAEKRLRRHKWDDIDAIRNSYDSSNPRLEIDVRNRPESLNRVLWQLGSEHYRNHSVDLDSGMQDGSRVMLSSMPEPVGGTKKLEDSVRYPEELSGSGVEGSVTVQFIVTEYGEAENPEIVESLHRYADREALSVIRQASYRPGMRNGLPVRVQIKISLLFRE